jgi:glucose-1-phosphate thymidylyltransferase
LAGGGPAGLHPVTPGVPHVLLPVYDTPLVYHPLSVLMLAGVTDVLVLGDPAGLPRIRALLGDGAHLGLRITHRAGVRPLDALPPGERVAVIRGGDIVHGSGLGGLLRRAVAELDGCTLFGSPGRGPRPDRGLTGLRLYDTDAAALAAGLAGFGELEGAYGRRGRVRVVELGRGFAWQDTGTAESLHAAAHYVRTLERRQGLRVACVEEVALRMGLIDADQCARLGAAMPGSPYGDHVRAVAARAAAGPAAADRAAGHATAGRAGRAAAGPAAAGRAGEGGAAQARQGSGPPWSSAIS